MDVQNQKLDFQRNKRAIFINPHQKPDTWTQLTVIISFIFNQPIYSFISLSHFIPIIHLEILMNSFKKQH